MSDQYEIPIRNLDAEAEIRPIISDVFGYWRSLNSEHLPHRKSIDFMSVYHTAPNLLTTACSDGRTL